MNRPGQKPILAAVVLAALTICGTADAQQWGATPQIGVGIGRFYRTEPGPSDTEVSRFALGFESKVSADLGDYVSFFLLTVVSINAVDTGVNYTQWVAQDDEYKAARILLGLAIPFAFLGDSHSIIGPGITVRVRQQNPAPFVEAGVGLSGVISGADRSYLFGSGFLGGAGVQITEQFGAGVRVVWTPARLDSDWTSSSAADALTVMGMVSFSGGPLSR